MHCRFLLIPLLLGSSSGLLCAATYYVQPGGDNAHGGLSIDKPLGNLGWAVQVLKPGDTLMVRGGVYRESLGLRPRFSGREGAPVTIQAYPGECPVIKGSDIVTGWELHQGAIWKKINWTGHTQQVFVDFDKKEGPPLNQIGASGGKNDHVRPVSGTGVSDMKPGTFFCDIKSDTLYVWLADSSDPNTHTIEASVRDALITTSIEGYEITQHYVFKGLAFRHCNASVRDDVWGWAISMPYNSRIEQCDIQWCDFGGLRTANNVEVINCIFANNGGVGLDTGMSANIRVAGCKMLRNNYRNFYPGEHAGGIKLIPDAYGIIENNEVAHNYGSGIWFDYCRTGKQSIIRNNYIHDNTGGTEEAGIKIEGSRNVLAYNNLVISNSGNGVLLFGSDQIGVYNNTIVGNTGIGAVHLGGVPRQKLSLVGNRIMNNIIADNGTVYDVLIQQGPDEVVKDNLSDYNLIYRFGGSIQCATGGTYIGTFRPVRSNLADWQANSPHDRHSISKAPGFRVGKGLDYKLAADSPAVGAGIELNQIDTTDYAGVARPKAGAWSIGAYQSPEGVTTDDAAARSVDQSVWFDDALPDLAAPGIAMPWVKDFPVRYWTWSFADPAPFSGVLALRSWDQPGRHEQLFESAKPFPIAKGDALYVYVYVDPNHRPAEIMLQWHDGKGWDHRAYWGADKINEGRNGTPSRHAMGPIPAAGKWVRLEVPARAVGLEGTGITGMTFSLFDGQASFDKVGKTVAK